MPPKKLSAKAKAKPKAKPRAKPKAKAKAKAKAKPKPKANKNKKKKNLRSQFFDTFKKEFNFINQQEMPLPLFMKGWVEDHNDSQCKEFETKCLENEWRFYTFVTPFIVHRQYSPHFLFGFETGVCRSPDIDDSQTKKIFDKNTMSNNQRFLYIITPRISDNLDTFVNSKAITINAYTAFTQIVQTCSTMGRLGIRHNDAHFGNWFLYNRGEGNSKPIYYKMGEEKYGYFEFSFFLMLADFDRSAVLDPIMGIMEKHINKNMVSSFDNQCTLGKYDSYDDDHQAHLASRKKYYSSEKCKDVQYPFKFCDEFNQCSTYDGGIFDFNLTIVRLAYKTKNDSRYHFKTYQFTFKKGNKGDHNDFFSEMSTKGVVKNFFTPEEIWLNNDFQRFVSEHDPSFRKFVNSSNNVVPNQTYIGCIVSDEKINEDYEDFAQSNFENIE
eukprot:Pgem_evm8s18256